jgi:AAA ATPase domain
MSFGAKDWQSVPVPMAQALAAPGTAVYACCTFARLALGTSDNLTRPPVRASPSHSPSLVATSVDFCSFRTFWRVRADTRNRNNRVYGQTPTIWMGSLIPEASSSKTHSQFFDSIRQLVYVGAVRIGTADTFPTPEDAGVSHADVGSRGEYAPWWYAQYVDEGLEKARRHRDEPGLTLRRQLDRFLSDLFPEGEANAELLARTSLVRLGLRNDFGSDWRRPINTGYGITYAFPVLVALLLAKRGQLIIIDSPEAHLHPRGQSMIGQLLADFAGAGVKIMVETHSEHVLNGIELLCAIR